MVRRRGQHCLTSRAKEYEVHVGADDKPPPHRLLRLNIKPMINTSCSSLRCSVNKHCLLSLKVLQEHDVGSIASMCPFSFHLLLICVDHSCIKARTCFSGLHIRVAYTLDICLLDFSSQLQTVLLTGVG